MTRPAPRTGWLLRAYIASSHLIGLIGPRHLRKRLARGREDPARWREKLGEAGGTRPVGPLVWLHAVGIGEVMALRGLIGAMASLRPDLHFLVTSSARSSAEVVAANLPPRTIHQYLPLDAPRYLARFLDHWRPDLSVWAEQDLWPGAVVASHRRGIPLALVNARMNARAFARRQRFRSLYRDLLARFALVAAQDEGTARHLAALCPGLAPHIGGSLKAAAPPLTCDPAVLTSLQATLSGRRLWLSASSHPEDEAVALAAHKALVAEDPSFLLIIAPRDPARRVAIAAAVAVEGLTLAVRSQGHLPLPATQVFLADTFGELGLWYRLAPVALVGGSFGPVEGHNPWEPAALGSAILHGPHVAHFAADYAALDAADAARAVSAATLRAVLCDPGLGSMAARAKALSDRGQGTLAPLAADLLALMAGGRA
ncbi:MAG: 3-deoxy-D-manno-octulosonic acid transferase [Rhodobacteraceae bacterium]|nr:3-deoxy-D-manno-octulosonic acid transferase [Paracoccaceae bacterium]